ncbi:hypothetical protein D3C76_1778920 [compost metagenome]
MSILSKPNAVSSVFTVPTSKLNRLYAIAPTTTQEMKYGRNISVWVILRNHLPATSNSRMPAKICSRLFTMMKAML